MAINNIPIPLVSSEAISLRQKPSLSVVVPVYNSQYTLTELADRLRETMLREGITYELILVDDCSSDASWQVIQNLAAIDECVRGISLLKNYGQHSANLCGFNAARYEYIATIDDDLQNPPEEIPLLLGRALEGVELVIGKFNSKKHTLARRLGSKFVQRINRLVFTLNSNIVLSNARVFHRCVFERFAIKEITSPYIPGLLLQHAYSIDNVEIQHHPRGVGKSQYTLRKLARLVSTILFVHSNIPLRLASSFGIACSTIGIVLAIALFFYALFHGFGIPGWASQMILISFFSALQIALISIVGEYLIKFKASINPMDRFIVYKQTYDK